MDRFVLYAGRLRAILARSLGGEDYRLTFDRTAIGLKRRRVAVMVTVFVVALGVRVLYWQDSQVEIDRHETLLTGLVNSYRTEALRITGEGGVLLPDKTPDSGDARMLVHPPGYSLLLVGLRNITSYRAVRTLQVVADSATPIVILLIAEQLLTFPIAVISAFLVALSPHLSYYSLWLTPDSLVALPILIAIWLLIKGMKYGRLWPFIACGGLIGLSCWLRSNGLLLAPFLSVAVVCLVRDRKWRLHAISISAAALAAILPLTVRNLVVFRQFVPTSLGSGITIIEGIADYDPAGRFGMPTDDVRASIMDSQWDNRPDYAQNLWAPDGIARDRDRFRRGLTVVWSHPLWFASVMARRAGFMLRYNDSGRRAWPLNTSRVPIVSPEPPFGHWPSSTQEAGPVASISAGRLMQAGTVESNGAQVRLSADSGNLIVSGDESAYGRQFASEPIAVTKRRDYLLDIHLKLEKGSAAIQVMNADRSLTLASIIIPPLARLEESISDKPKRAARSVTAPSTVEIDNGRKMVIAHIVFSSGMTDLVRIVLGNNGATPAGPLVEIGRADLYSYGPTPNWWTLFPRVVIHGIQGHLFKTGKMLLLVIIGVFLLGVFGDRRALVVLAAVPVYYMITQSALHTEYRYILPIHYFLFIFGGITLAMAGKVAQGIGVSLLNLTRRRLLMPTLARPGIDESTY